MMQQSLIFKKNWEQWDTNSFLSPLLGGTLLNASAFDLARGYTDSDMSAYVDLQDREFEMESDGYSATRHQREVGAGYFDDVSTVITGGSASTRALSGSTEEEQF